MLQQLQFKALRFGEKLLRTRKAALLAPLGFIWRLISSLRNRLYDRGFLSIHRVSIPVVSVGNLSVGGTGKTPLVILLAKQFPKKRVAIIARGYGSAPNEWSDEMKVIRRHLPFVKLYQGANRVELAKRARYDGAEWILLDDGFQHRRLHRDFDLLCVRAADFTDSFLPRGRLRDSLSQMKRASALFSDEPLGRGEIVVEPSVKRIVDRNGQKISSLSGQKVALFCGIGRPERFKKTVAGLGAEIVLEKILGDHEPLLSIDAFYEKSKALSAKYLVCTEKDFVKLGPTELPIVYVEIEAKIVQGQKEWEKLVAKIDDRLNNWWSYGRPCKN